MRKNFKALQAGVQVIKHSLASVPQQQLASNVKMMALLDSISKELKTKSEHNEESRITFVETKEISDVFDDILTRYSLPVDEVYTLKSFDKDLTDEKCFTKMVSNSKLDTCHRQHLAKLHLKLFQMSSFVRLNNQTQKVIENDKQPDKINFNNMTK